MAQVYENVLFRNKIGIPTILGSRSRVIQKNNHRKCATSIVERVPPACVSDATSCARALPLQACRSPDATSFVRIQVVEWNGSIDALV